MKQYELYEICLKGEKPGGSQVEINLSAEFDNEGMHKTVKGFYAGDGIYKVRYYPQKCGKVRWKIDSDIQLEGRLEGEETCIGGTKHGMVKAVDTHFEYEDGTLFRPFGTTIYAFVHQTEELINQTFETLKKSPFNKVRLCVFPKYYDYNHEDPKYFPFEKNEKGQWDTDHPCLAFWNRLEEMIFRLADLQIQTDLILFHPYDKWGFSNMQTRQNETYLEYVMRRLGAVPEIWWSMANEFDLCFDRNMEEWYGIEQKIKTGDVYGHLLSNHNCFSFYDFKRSAITHCSVQSSQLESAEKWLEEYQKPFIYDECCYEGNLTFSWGNISAFELVNRFWMACAQGAYATHGEVFLSEDEILWWSKGGKLKGESVPRIAFLKDLMESLPGAIELWKMSPMDLLDEEVLKELQGKPFEKLHRAMPESMQESHLVKDKQFCGHCGSAVYLQYFARHCVAVAEWKLPEEGSYQIDVIDVWNMTRKTVMRGVCGRVRIKLPGKEGIAVIASRE